MARLIGIGGVFLFADDTERLAQWYRIHLGLDLVRMDEPGARPTFYVELYHRDLDEVEVRRHIVFSIMPAAGTLTNPRNQAMMNGWTTSTHSSRRSPRPASSANARTRHPTPKVSVVSSTCATRRATGSSCGSTWKPGPSMGRAEFDSSRWISDAWGVAVADRGE